MAWGELERAGEGGAGRAAWLGLLGLLGLEGLGELGGLGGEQSLERLETPIQHCISAPGGAGVPDFPVGASSGAYAIYAHIHSQIGILGVWTCIWVSELVFWVSCLDL